MKFTDRGIKALKPTGKRYEVSETNGRGLRLRVSATGMKTFVYVFRRTGKLQRLTLGAVGDITLNDAHAIHSELRKRARAGEAIQALRAYIGSGRTSGDYTVKDLANEWMERRVKVKRKTWRDVDRMLEKDVIPYLGDRPVDDVKAREITGMLDLIVDRGSPVSANRCAALVKQMFKFAIGRGIVHTSPCVALEKPGGAEPPRDRNLTDAEIKRLWQRLDKAGMTPGTRGAIRFLLVTGQRRGELARARRDEFDLKAKLWHIPAAHSKNRKAHDVPLSNLALEVLAGLDTLAGDSEYLLPSPSVKDAPIHSQALTRAITRNREKFKIEAFNVHDLRRTAASQMTALGIPRLHVSKILNHTGRDVTAVYDRHDYADDKRKALNLWADTLRAIIKGKRKKVVKIRQAAI